MDSIWNSFKDRRYAALFFVTLLAGIGTLLGLLAFFGMSNLEEYFLQALPVIGILIMALIWQAIRRARARRRERLQYPPMARDEIRKARSKLVNKNKT